jgi:hypothetical protein
MIRLAVTEAAYQVILMSLSNTSRVRAIERLDGGGYWLWLDRTTADQLARLRCADETVSDVIIRLAALETA